MNTIGQGSPNGQLPQSEIHGIITRAVEEMDLDGRSVLVITPDQTRTCPLPAIARALHDQIAPRASKMDFLVALGTHPALGDAQLDRLFGVEPGGRPQAFPGSTFINHEWMNAGALAKLGTIPAKRIAEVTGGLFEKDVDVTINKRVLEYDVVLIAGPVFPHEVVGFSGGDKYFFPGVCGEALLNFFHWLGAVITCPKIIGNRETPVRHTLDLAAEMLTMDKYALCMVVAGDDLCGLYFGPVREAWERAADLSTQVHVKYCDKPFTSVLSRAPEMYDEIWVGAKCMYKLEPVVADGGELIIYAPHIKEISATHGPIIEEIGYHTRDYFLAQWEQFKDYPWGVLAHSTHVKGIGTYEDGVEKPRIQVTLATGIPEETCRRINLGYRDPAGIDISRWEGREDEGYLYVPKAGEVLHKLKNPPPWQVSG